MTNNNNAEDRTPSGETPITFWTFKKCDKQRCQHNLLHGHTNQPHLIITSTSIKLEDLENNPARNFAVSYAWGREPRQKRYLGHCENGKKHFKVRLGPEWNMKGFVDQLAKFSNGSRYGWLDQASDMGKKGKYRRPFTSIFLPQTESSKEAKKKDDHATHVINHIPHIYRTCEVFALFPGQTCKCVKSSRDSMIQGNSVGPQPDIPTSTGLPDCLNNIDLVSWWGRLWPRQEFIYARKISVAWTSDNEDQQCVQTGPPSAQTALSSTQIKNLTTLCRMHFEEFFWLQARSRTSTTCQGACRTILRRHPWRRLEVMLLSVAREKSTPEASGPDSNDTPSDNIATCPCAYALKMFKSYQLLYYETMELSLKEKLRGHDARNRLQAFLRGGPIETEMWYNQDEGSRPSDVELLSLFVNHIGLLGRANRHATDAHDLIRAVWPDCPRYEFPTVFPSGPQDYRKRDYRDLLEDAIEQMQTNFDRALVTTAPRGLFPPGESSDKQSPSWGWSPKSYLQSRENCSNSTSYAYGPMAPPYLSVPISHDERGTPFLAMEFKGSNKMGPKQPSSKSAQILAKEPKQPLSKGAQSFEKMFTAEANKEDVRIFMRKVVQCWADFVVNRCQGPEVLSLGRMLGTRNPFLLETVLPLMAEEQGWILATYAGLAIRRFVLDKKLHKGLVITIAGKENQQKVSQILEDFRDGANTAEEAIADYLDLPVSEFRRRAYAWIRKFLIEKRASRIDKIKKSKQYQTIRDQRFLDGIIGANDGSQARTEERAHVAPTRGPVPVPQDVAMSDPVAEPMVNTDYNMVHHIDTVYYLVSEALGLRPQDIGLDYEKSWKEGNAYKQSRLRLMVSGGEQPMLGFTSRDPEQLGREADGNVMTVAFQKGGKPPGEEDKQNGTVYYEVQRLPEGREGWVVVGVWVPVKVALPRGVLSAWFGEGAQDQARLY